MIAILLAVVALGAVRSSPARAAESTFCHQIDGTFTDCPAGGSNEEWSDVPNHPSLQMGSFSYFDQNAAHTELHAIFDYVLGNCPLGPSQCGRVQFGVKEANGDRHKIKIHIGNCATNSFDVFVDGTKLPEANELGVQARGGCAPSPNSVTPHQIYELSVPLGGVYPLGYAVGERYFWATRFPAPPLVTGRDFDGDGVNDESDNCPYKSNPGQTDFDGDGIGNVCDKCAGIDTDVDGVADGLDNCPAVPNKDQTDFDADGIGDACDSCPKDSDDLCDKPRDQDKDEFEDSEDNCPTIFNPEQEDDDGDGLGNTCDRCPADATNTCDCDEPSVCGNGTLEEGEQCDDGNTISGDGCQATCKLSGALAKPLSLPRAVPSAEDIEANASLVTAGSDGSTARAARGLCGSPDACLSPDPNAPKTLLKYMKKRYSLLLACIKKGEANCDLSKLTTIIVPGFVCKGLLDCLSDTSMELMLGSRNPPPPATIEKCRKSIGTQGSKFVATQMNNEIKNKVSATPPARDKSLQSISNVCSNSVPVPPDALELGGDCVGLLNDAALECLFDGLETINPLP